MTMTLSDFLNPEYMLADPEDCDYSDIDFYIKTAQAFARAIYHPVFIVDYCKKSVLYASDNFMYLCGMTPEQFKEQGFNLYFDRIPEEELPMMEEIINKTRELMYSLPMEIRHKLTISYYFSLMNNKRKRLVLQKITPLKLTKDGKMWISLCTLSMSSRKKPGMPIIQEMGDHDFYYYSLDKHAWFMREGFNLSETEKDILQLSSQGYTMKEIADVMHKSEDAIKSIKRILFAKLDVRSITEAVFAAINHDLIH